MFDEINLVVVIPSPAEPGLDEVLEVVLGHVHQLRQRADHHHVRGAVVAGRARQGVDGQAEGPRVGHGEVVGVVNYDAAFPHLFGVGLVGFLVKGDQHVHLVA